MRYNLLEMTKILLSAMDGDDVNTVTETIESVQLTTLIKNVYYDLATELDLPEHETLFELDASGDNTKPTLMTVPTKVTKINTIKYDNKLTGDTYSDWKTVNFMPFDEFLSMQNALREETSNVGEMVVTANSESHEFMYRTDAFPLWYTTFDDYTLIFNSHKSNEDTTLQKEKTMVAGAVYPDFTIADNFAPDLDPTQFAYFLQKCKVRAYFEMKQLRHLNAEAEERRQKIGIQRKRRRTPKRMELHRLPNYGKT